MTVLPVSTVKAHVGKHELSITVRHLGDNKTAAEVTTIATRTVKMWLALAALIEANVRIVPEAWAEVTIDSDKDFVGAETRVTVFSWSYTLPHGIGLTVHSDTVPQHALDTWYSLADTLEALTPATAPQAPPASATPPAGTERPAQPKNPPQAPNVPPAAVEGAIVATRAPKSSELQYAEGQLVCFNINKIETGSNKGSTLFKMWSSPLGSQWPVINVYMKKPNGDPKPDYTVIKPVIDTLGFSLEKTEAVGNWQLVAKVAHVNGKEYFNTISLTAV